MKTIIACLVCSTAVLLTYITFIEKPARSPSILDVVPDGEKIILPKHIEEITPVYGDSMPEETYNDCIFGRFQSGSDVKYLIYSNDVFVRRDEVFKMINEIKNSQQK